MRLFFWVVVGTTVFLTLVMLGWSLPLIVQEADGLLPFDLRLTGYSLAQATDFLNALSEEGRAFYLGTQMMLDMIYPVLLAASLILLVRRVIRGLALRLLLSLIALAGMVADYIENGYVIAMLQNEAGQLSAATVSNASLWSMVKSGCDAVVILAVVLGAIAVAVRRWMPR